MKHQSSSTESSLPIIKKWYAVYVRSRHEKSVHELLFGKGIESSLALKTIYRQWSDRKKKVEVPLFRGYVFVNIDISKEKLSVLRTDGVVKFLTFCNKTVSIPEEQMYWLDRLLSTSNVEHEQEFTIGADVEVEYGPLKGLRGKIKQKPSETRLVVWFDTIMQGVSVEINPALLSVCNSKKIEMRPNLLQDNQFKSVKSGENIT